MNNKILPYSTGNYVQHPETGHNGKEYEKECVYRYRYVKLDHCAVSRSYYNIVNQLYFCKILKKKGN